MAKKRPEDETALAPIDVPDPYPYQTPRYVHREGEAPRLVETPEDCARALASGWSLYPDWIVG